MQSSLRPSFAERLTAIADLFAWPLKASHYAELVNPLWSRHRLQARVAAVQDETADARTLVLRPNLGWRGHRAGQHLRVGVELDGRQYTRTYSISSPPERDDGCLTITVKAMDDGRVSTHLVRRVVPGEVLTLGAAQGDFCLPEARPVQPLFLTAGSGVTPVMAMLRSLAAQGRLTDVAHVHYARHADEVIFGRELRALAAEHPGYRLHEVHTRGVQAARAGERHFDASRLDARVPDWREREAYACGPQALLDAAESHWRDAGLAGRLHTERFRAALAPADRAAQGGAVRFAGAGRSVVADGATPLLRVAEEAGLNPRHGCRMGICHTCPRRLLSGQVRDLRTGQVHGEAGDKVLICVSAAAGDCEIDL